MSRWLAYWIPPVLANGDAETRRRAQLLVWCATLLLVASPVMTVVYGARGAPVFVDVFLVVGSLLPLPLLVLKHTRCLDCGAHLCCLLLWGTFACLMMLTGGVHAPVLANNVMVVMLATLLLGERGGIVWGGVAATTCVAASLLTQSGIGVRQVLQPDSLAEFRTAEPLAGSLLALGICIVYERVKNRMLRAVESERARAERAHADTRLILDNVGQGFVMLDTRGIVLGESSAAAQRWLPGLRPAVAFADVLRPLDSTLAQTFALGWEQLVDGLLPMELNLAQMPTRLELSGRTCSLEYRALLDAGEGLERVVVILTDVTSRLARERAEAEQSELLGAFRRILGDRAGMAEFLEEASVAVEQVAGAVDGDLGGDVGVRRSLHTLKGNAAVMGFGRLASLCHDLETELSELGGLSAERCMDLELAWRGVAAQLESLLGDRRHDDVVLPRDVYDRFLGRMLSDGRRPELAREVHLWSYEPLEARLRRHGDWAKELCERLGKTTLEVVVDAGGMRLASNELGPFWQAFVHVVRNAMDHGIETPAQRQASGKPARPTLALKAYEREGALVIEVADDGRGVDWDAVARRARERGLPSQSEGDLIDALFADGLTTRKQATDLSGRGVGLAAVRQSCEQLGGRIRVESRLGQGTRFLFSFPLSRVEAGALSQAA